jgi:Ca2+-binding EF-hand superfamily protein
MNNNGSLDGDEFAKCCRLNNLGLSPSDVNLLHRQFDQDGSGSVGYEEFLRALRGRLNPTRKHIVKKIFDVLDKCALLPAIDTLSSHC